eukprot:gene8971-16612_t
MLLSLSSLILVISLAIAFGYRFLKLKKHSLEKVKSFLYNKDSQGNEAPIVIGHRGGQYEAPENTLIAIKTAKRNGSTAVELDLAFTDDGYGIIIHDETVDRTTNGTGEVSNFRFHEIRKLNAASKLRTLRYAEGKIEVAGFEQIPTLKEVVELCKDIEMKIILDVKSDAMATANAILKLSQEIQDLDKFMIVTSFYPQVLYSVKWKCPSFLTGLIWRYDYCNLKINGEPRFSGIQHYLMHVVDILGEFLVHSWLPDFLGLDAVSMNKDHLSRRYINKWRAKNVELMAWTVNNPLEKDFFLKNLKIPIITDSLLNFEECPEQEI